jgi:hypothetical protein
MTKDEALDLALEVLQINLKLLEKINPYKGQEDLLSDSLDLTHKAINAIKQARALDKKAENARELGLDYEPADGTQVSKVWWDGEKLMAKPIPLKDLYQPVQEPVAWMVDVDLANYQGQSEYRTILAWNAKPVWSGTPEVNEVLKAVPLYTTPPAAQRQWVGLTDEEIGALDYSGTRAEFVKAIEAKLRSKNT